MTRHLLRTWNPALSISSETEGRTMNPADETPPHLLYPPQSTPPGAQTTSQPGTSSPPAYPTQPPYWTGQPPGYAAPLAPGAARSKRITLIGSVLALIVFVIFAAIGLASVKTFIIFIVVGVPLTIVVAAVTFIASRAAKR